MLETRRGSENGLIVKRFQKNQEYQIADGLANEFFAKGWAIPVGWVRGVKKDTSSVREESVRCQNTGGSVLS